MYNSRDDEEGLLLCFEDFPPIPQKGQITVCEINSYLQTTVSTDSTRSADASFYTHLTEKYFPINENHLKPFLPRIYPTIRTDGHDESFLLPIEQGCVKAVWDGWNDNGWPGVIRGLRNSGGSPVIVNVLTSALNLWRKIRSINQNISKFFFPHLALSTEELIDRYAPVRSWRKSWLRSLAWHPQATILAIALKDDTVRIFSTKRDASSLLKTVDQKMISALAWRPYSNELALGVEFGMIVWKVDCAVKTGSSKSTFLSLPGHAPVTSVDYNNTGYYLLSSSSADTSMIIWEVNSGRHGALYRLGGGGVPRARWSPHPATKIFSTSPTSVFRLWIKDKSTAFVPRNWTTPTKYVEAFVWSPCGTMILFVSDCKLFVINMNPSQIEFVNSTIKHEAVPVFDFKESFIPQLNSDLLFKAGGQVLDLAWDETGKRLAVLFADSDVVALFRIETSSSGFIFPCGFIRGHDGEFPVAIVFQKEFQAGAMLTIAWSTQRIQYFPMIFSEYAIGKQRFQQEAHRLDRNRPRPQQLYSGPPIGDSFASGFSENTIGTEPSRRSTATAFKLFSPQ